VTDAGHLDVECVDFVTVPIRDVARARRFYGDVLGLPASPVNPDEFETPNLTLSLWQPEADAVPFTPNTEGIALRVADVEAARARLTAEPSSRLTESGRGRWTAPAPGRG
jgi:catechol 2,3-dioxygenase-like lactoylglutathione lyase family enzyme